METAGLLPGLLSWLLGKEAGFCAWWLWGRGCFMAWLPHVCVSCLTAVCGWVCVPSHR